MKHSHNCGYPLSGRNLFICNIILRSKKGEAVIILNGHFPCSKYPLLPHLFLSLSSCKMSEKSFEVDSENSLQKCLDPISGKTPEFLLANRIFFNCYLATPRSILGHYQGGSFTHPMLITVLLHIQPENLGHREPCNDHSGHWGINPPPPHLKNTTPYFSPRPPPP